MGDKRLSARLVKSADLLGAVPGRKINANSASDRTARRRGPSGVAAAHHARRPRRQGRRRDRRLPPPEIEDRGLLPRAQIGMPDRVPAVPHRRPAAEGGRDQRLHRLAHHGDGGARPPGARLRAGDDVHGPRAGLPGQLRRLARLARPGPAGRRRAARRPSRRLPRPQARSGPRAPDHVARPDKAGKRGDGPPDRLIAARQRGFQMIRTSH